MSPSMPGIPDLSQHALDVAPQLLDCALCVVDPTSGSVQRLAITEVEAYHGFDDKASHAHRGMTARNAVMFGPPGHWYVYLCYGVHWLLNLVTAEAGYPSAVLIRGVQGSNGPGKLTRALGIDKRFNSASCSVQSGLWIESLPADHGMRQSAVKCSGRIGVGYAGDHWAQVPWRFYREACI